MTALIGSTTRKYTTASTRTLTLSLVMPSWAGTAMAMICMLTFCSLSPMGRMMVSPGPRVSGRTLPNRKISPRSYCCTTRMLRPTTVSPPTTRMMRTTRSAASMGTPLFCRCARPRRPPSRSSLMTIRPGARAALYRRPELGAGADNLMLVRARDTDWEGVRLHVVTGKGGTGKTTVTAALALALARRGRKVLLIEVEGRQGIAQLFDCPPLPYAERRVSIGLGEDGRPGGELY